MHVYKWRKWLHKWGHSSLVTSLKRLVRLQSCEKKKQWAGSLLSVKYLFCAKTTVNESHNFWLARLKYFGCLGTLWFRTFLMLFCATVHAVRHETCMKIIYHWKFPKVRYDMHTCSLAAVPTGKIMSLDPSKSSGWDGRCRTQGSTLPTITAMAIIITLLVWRK